VQLVWKILVYEGDELVRDLLAVLLPVVTVFDRTPESVISNCLEEGRMRHTSQSRGRNGEQAQ
jgi:hypothetical protein